ncbi:MAG TPA: GtrA family protein [Parafilimonas sp.]|nr:GtrA family protein [Parafilimonas sp.]
MQKIHAFISRVVLAIVDFFYPLFRRFMPLQTYRYAACGGANMLLDIAIFSYAYNYLAEKQLVYIGSFVLKPFVFAFIISFVISFPIGFYLSRYVVWQQTETKKRIQIFRYLLVVAACIGLNYLLLNIFVQVFHWWPTFSKIVTSIFVVLFSYLTQRNFSFRPVRSSLPADAVDEA